MKILIDIDKEDYEYVMDNSETWTIDLLDRLYLAVHHGKVVSDDSNSVNVTKAQ